MQFRSPPPVPKLAVFSVLARCRLANWNPCALLLQKFRARLLSPFQWEYGPDILEGKEQSVADISVTVLSSEAQQILT